MSNSQLLNAIARVQNAPATPKHEADAASAAQISLRKQIVRCVISNHHSTWKMNEWMDRYGRMNMDMNGQSCGWTLDNPYLNFEKNTRDTYLRSVLSACSIPCTLLNESREAIIQPSAYLILAPCCMRTMVDTNELLESAVPNYLRRAIGISTASQTIFL